MSPTIHLLILNHNGRELLEECLPSILEAARECRWPSPVTVVDNASTDDSTQWLAERYPETRIWLMPNLGLASFNEVLQSLRDDVVLLLNNDVKLSAGAIEPLVEAVWCRPEALFAAPQCWTFDGQTYEGMRTRVRSRFGLIQGLCRIPGHERWVNRPGLTAAAGPILAVCRSRFLEIGGYDPIYRPGRIEDLDLGFRAWVAGYRGYYVPESVAYHKGFGSFGPAFGAGGCDRLAIRNTILFAWKNYRGRRLASHLVWLAARSVHAVTRGRWVFLRALAEAVGRLDEVRRARKEAYGNHKTWLERQEAFFHEFRFDAS